MTSTNTKINDSISVVIATYNGSDFIKYQIESILNGTIIPFEIIIVDDNSKDNTLEIIKGFSCSNIKIFRNSENIGPHETFKRAIKLATGKYIAPCDQDDIWESNHLELLYDIIKDDKYDLVFGQDRIMYEDGEIKNQTLRFNGIEKIIFGNNIPGHLQMFSQKCKEVYEIAPSVTFDWGTVLYAAANKGINSIDAIICTWRRHKNVVTTAYTKKYNKYGILSKGKYYKTFYTMFQLLKGIKSKEIERTMHNNFLILDKYTVGNKMLNDYAKVCKYLSTQNILFFVYAAIIYTRNATVSNYKFRDRIASLIYAFCYPFVWWYDYHTHTSL